MGYAMFGIPQNNKIYDENDWNNDFSLEQQPYAYSKTETEKTAWNWMKEHAEKINFDFISLLLPLVIGAQLNAGKLTSSNIVIYNILKSRTGKVNIVFPIIDVCDTAALHIFFIENPKALKQGKGRYCIWSSVS